ncbi:MAG: nucleotide exchange factor GrpE [Candidatus Dormibacteraceae bacterium]
MTTRSRRGQPEEPEEPEVLATTAGRAPAPGTRAAASAEQPGAGEVIGQLQAELEESANRHLRLAADFENYKKRARQDQLDTIQYGSTELILRLLPVLDDLRLVLDHAPAGVEGSWLQGLRLTAQKLEEVLAAQGVTPIVAVGTPFDPGLHEAIGHEETDEQPEDTVIQELRRGYRLHERVVRPALVKLARPALTGG